VTVPVFSDGAVVAFVQAFGHHDDIGGAVPGSMPSQATSVFEEGLMVPPIRLWDAGVPNRAALAIMTRNSRMPESLAADLDAECSACLMGARRLGELFDRYGVADVEACFDAIIDRTTSTYRREILGRIPVGRWTWEDYAEHDGVDEPQLHTQRITLTRTPADDPEGERLILDFDGTGPQARGPINHCGDYSDGVFLKKWLAPILRNLAETPERMAQLDVNEGIVPLIEMRFPEPGTLLTPVFPAPTNARTFVILRLLGVLAGVVAKAVDGRMPADQETIRYTGVYGEDLEGRPYLMREVLGGGSGGRYYADGEDTIHVVPDSRNLPTEFTEARFPFRVESLALAMDSGGPGEFRGGLGYEKQIRMLKDAHFMSIADRSILACWGVRGGLAGQPFEVVIDPGGPHERQVDALADAEEVRAGEVIRIRTTGGGGWGNPLVRDPVLVVRDVVWRKVSPAAALAAYGVVLTGSLDDDTLGHDEAATAAERAGRPPAGDAFFDRGPGYARLSGSAAADVDFL
jgi:N-methylhydantoinase B